MTSGTLRKCVLGSSVPLYVPSNPCIIDAIHFLNLALKKISFIELAGPITPGKMTVEKMTVGTQKWRWTMGHLQRRKKWWGKTANAVMTVTSITCLISVCGMYNKSNIFECCDPFIHCWFLLTVAHDATKLQHATQLCLFAISGIQFSSIQSKQFPWLRTLYKTVSCYELHTPCQVIT